MKATLHLKGNKTYRWESYENISFLGYFFDDENNLYQGKSAAEFIFNQLKTKKIQEFCNYISGLFSIVIIKENKTVLVSDELNFFPLFYSYFNEQLIVSDYFDEIIAAKKEFKLNKNAIAEYTTAGFVLLNETLESTIYKTNANQILNLKENSVETTQYSHFLTDTFLDNSYDELKKQTVSELDKVAQKMIQFLDHRYAIVPLSGGYDSRLIVSLLKKMNFQKVICFTYGKYNPEVPISQEVANNLGFDWHFIDFDDLNLDKIKNQYQYKSYLEFAGNGYSMPYLMEYFAVAELIDKKIIPENSVFLPGHSGDFLGGSYIAKTVKNNWKINKIPEVIAAKYFIFIKKDAKTQQQLQQRIDKSITENSTKFVFGDYNTNIEEWDIQEKLSKFIFHSSQVFLFFGHSVYFPLWDKNLKSFFRKVPLPFRENKTLYDDVLRTDFFEPQLISFPKKELEVSAFKVKIQKIKDAVRYFFPWTWVVLRINLADWPNYQRLTEEMKTDWEKKNHTEFKNFKNYNAVICAWYLQHLQNKYSDWKNHS